MQDETGRIDQTAYIAGGQREEGTAETPKPEEKKRYGKCIIPASEVAPLWPFDLVIPEEHKKDWKKLYELEILKMTGEGRWLKIDFGGDTPWGVDAASLQLVSGPGKYCARIRFRGTDVEPPTTIKNYYFFLTEDGRILSKEEAVSMQRKPVEEHGEPGTVELRYKIRELEREIERYKAELETERREKEMIKSTSEKKIELKEEELRNLRTQYDSIKSDYEKLRKDYEHLREKYDKELRDREDKIKLEYEKKLAEAEKKALERAQSEIQRLQDELRREKEKTSDLEKRLYELHTRPSSDVSLAAKAMSEMLRILTDSKIKFEELSLDKMDRLLQHKRELLEAERKKEEEEKEKEEVEAAPFMMPPPPPRTSPIDTFMMDLLKNVSGPLIQLLLQKIGGNQVSMSKTELENIIREAQRIGMIIGARAARQRPQAQAQGAPKAGHRIKVPPVFTKLKQQQKKEG